METYIFGDIEGNVEIFKNTNKCILKNWNNAKFIFLGDIYTPENLQASICMVKLLLSYFYKPKNFITNDSEPLDVIRIFRKLWKDKGLKSYSTKYKQYWRSVPKKEKILNSGGDGNCDGDGDDNFKCRFIFGNKEIEFLYDILNSKNITKLKYTNGNTYFHVPVKYLNTKTKNEEDVIRIYSYDQLNIMYNYLSNCHNYLIENRTLYIHCYFNCSKINDVDNVIAGHNKGYGKFKDSRYEKIAIYIIDLTSKREKLNNYILCANGKFQLFNKEILPEGLSYIESWKDV